MLLVVLLVLFLLLVYCASVVPYFVEQSFCLPFCNHFVAFKELFRTFHCDFAIAEDQNFYFLHATKKLNKYSIIYKLFNYLISSAFKETFTFYRELLLIFGDQNLFPRAM